jgi:superfamily I DNA/RNA helicase
MTGSAHASAAAERTKALAALLSSSAQRKVVVAGPGTGKTHSFRELLKAHLDPKLVLTFINALAADLATSLDGLAETRTFHSYCAMLLFQQGGEGVTPGATYYPGLNRIQATDYSLLEGLRRRTNHEQVEAVFHSLDDGNPILERALQGGSYYNAVGYTDSVYRVLRYFQRRPALTPTYSLVVVDEYQDFSPLEVAFIDVLAASSPMVIVGDDDQALYEGKFATPQFLRRLVNDPAWDSFELPYCSRCTAVVVEAVGRIVEHAQARGLLAGRVPKRFVCYLPEKRADSERYPTITHVRCTVQRRNSPLMAKHIEREIRAIPREDIEESIERRIPTVLVTGPGHFMRSMHEYLVTRFAHVDIKQSPDPGFGLLDGYALLLKRPQDRLGLRILCEHDEPPAFARIVEQAIVGGGELVDLLPKDYVDRHEGVLDLLRRIHGGELLDEGQTAAVTEATRVSLEELVAVIGPKPEEPEDKHEVPPEEPTSEPEPWILCSTLVGAKGLEAGHVFVVGVNDSHFPRDNRNPTDVEVCSFVVALTRARKKAYVLSCGSFGGTACREGVFIPWLGDLADHVSISAADFR